MSARVTVVVDGRGCEVPSGCSVAAALLAIDRRRLRNSVKRVEPRGLYCGMGICFDCIVAIDGHVGQRSCLIEVRAGMRIDTV